MENNHSFEFTYSAEQQQEIKAIREKYLPKGEDKMETLRKLHSIPTRKAQAGSIALGLMGALVLGTGMSLCMTPIGAALGSFSMVLGILIGITGMVMTALACPMYHRILKKERQRIAPEILQLTEELMTN